MEIADLQDRLTQLHEDAVAIRAAADTEKRDLTKEEEEQLTANLDQFEKTTRDIEQRKRIERQNQSLEETLSDTNRVETETRKTSPADPEERSGNHPSREPARAEDRKNGRWGWRSMGQFAQEVRTAFGPHRTIHPFLEERAPTTFGSEAIGEDGGFAVPPDFRAGILQEVMGEDSLLARTSQQEISGNSMTFPKDEDTPWSSDGIQAYWESEGNQLTQSKPKLERSTITLNKLTVLVPVTEELLEDVAALGAYLSRKIAEKMTMKINTALIGGTGTGEPLGILNAASTISVTKFASQVADTVVGVNVINMYSRMYAPWRGNAVWLINQDVEPQLLTLMKVGKLDTGAVDTGWGMPLYLPPGGISGQPFATIFGRPVVPTQACETLGDVGDIIFADLNQYEVIQKAGGINMQTSIHLFFDYDVTAFRAIFRMAGQPRWSAAISPRDGATTLSAFVTLAERT